MALFIRQWTAVRDLLGPPGLTAQPPAALAARLTAAYQSVSAHLDRLVMKELRDGRTDHAGRGRERGPGHRLSSSARRPQAS